jgi:cold shock CspA family protein
VLGTVVAFDDPRGLGTIEADGTEYPFHCTALLDGTRTIEVGTPVAFEVRPAGMGRWEATEIAPRPASP